MRRRSPLQRSLAPTSSPSLSMLLLYCIILMKVILPMLAVVRNFIPAHEQVARGDWDVAAVAKVSFDIEGKVVATVGVGRIGERVLRRLGPFNCKELLYY